MINSKKHLNDIEQYSKKEADSMNSNNIKNNNIDHTSKKEEMPMKHIFTKKFILTLIVVSVISFTTSFYLTLNKKNENSTAVESIEASKTAKTEEATEKNATETQDEQTETTKQDSTAPKASEDEDTTEHVHTWESYGHTEVKAYRADNDDDVTDQQIVRANGSDCVIVGSASGAICHSCGFKGSVEETKNHIATVHKDDTAYGEYTEPEYAKVVYKTVYVEDGQVCTKCHKTK